MKPTKTLRLLKCDRGATAVEYGLITALVALVAYGEVAMMGTALDAVMRGPAAAMDQAALMQGSEDDGQNGQGQGQGNGNGNDGEEGGENALGF